MVLKKILRLTFLEIVKAEVTNPPGLHIEVGQGRLIGRTEAGIGIPMDRCFAIYDVLGRLDPETSW